MKKAFLAFAVMLIALTDTFGSSKAASPYVRKQEIFNSAVKYVWILENDGCFHLWSATLTTSFDNTGYPVPSIEWKRLDLMNFIGTTTRCYQQEVFEKIC